MFFSCTGGATPEARSTITLLKQVSVSGNPARTKSSESTSQFSCDVYTVCDVYDDEGDSPPPSNGNGNSGGEAAADLVPASSQELKSQFIRRAVIAQVGGGLAGFLWLSTLLLTP
mmetsp:Transcript_5631/g.12967  ORF Transcript_5631/g.12967 Transcript_5631/m.12967 type:complete len:115 (+) Transcript_5631:897-1241(+)